LIGELRGRRGEKVDSSRDKQGFVLKWTQTQCCLVPPPQEKTHLIAVTRITDIWKSLKTDMKYRESDKAREIMPIEKVKEG
jgi:hypothetical protein